MLREERGLTEEQMAQMLGIGTANYRRIEAAKFAVDIDTLNRIAAILHAAIYICKLADHQPQTDRRGIL